MESASQAVYCLLLRDRGRPRAARILSKGFGKSCGSISTVAVFFWPRVGIIGGLKKKGIEMNLNLR